jgi:hypothetical protein
MSVDLKLQNALRFVLVSTVTACVLCTTFSTPVVLKAVYETPFNEETVAFTASSYLLELSVLMHYEPTER